MEFQRCFVHIIVLNYPKKLTPLPEFIPVDKDVDLSTLIAPTDERHFYCTIPTLYPCRKISNGRRKPSSFPYSQCMPSVYLKFFFACPHILYLGFHIIISPYRGTKGKMSFQRMNLTLLCECI